ncbi:hypothetical protein ID871_32780 [Streptomyces pratensis]|nr:hypothetical protein [Streptomyces pratensis]
MLLSAALEGLGGQSLALRRRATCAISGLRRCAGPHTMPGQRRTGSPDDAHHH